MRPTRVRGPHPHRVIGAVSARMLAGETTPGPGAGQRPSPWWVLAMPAASDRTVGVVPVAEAARWRAVSVRTGPAPTMLEDDTAVECGIGGVAATRFSEMRANARPARKAGPIVRPPRFRPAWADEGAHRRALNRPDGLLVAKWGGRAYGAMTNQRNDRRSPLPSQQSWKCPLTCGSGARGGIRTLDLPITSRKPSSSVCRPDPFWLLTSAGSSVECVPDRWRYGRGNDCQTARPAKPPDP
jgi:hypothetical protein